MVSWKFQDRIFPSGEQHSLLAPTEPRFVKISGPGRDDQTRVREGWDSSPGRDDQTRVQEGWSSDGEIKV